MLKLAVERRPGGRNLLEQLFAYPIHRACLTELDPHPSGGVGDFGIRRSDTPGRRFILRLPEQEVVIPPLAEMQKTAHRHQEVEGRVELFACRDRKERTSFR